MGLTISLGKEDRKFDNSIIQALQAKMTAHSLRCRFGRSLSMSRELGVRFVQ